MLTFTSQDGRSLTIEAGKKKLVFFPNKAVSGALSFFAKPEETPSEGTVSWPGEYDIEGIGIRGIGQDQGGHVSYVIEAEGVRCAILPAPMHEWSDHDIELLGDVAVMAIQGDDGKMAQKVIEEVDPRVIIPLSSEKSTVNDVLKLVGAVGTESVKEWKLKGGLPAEGRQVVVLN